jgi:hypothetical protein
VSVKNRKPRKVPIIEKLAALLADHFVLLGQPAEGLLFPSASRSDWPIEPDRVPRRPFLLVSNLRDIAQLDPLRNV